MEDGEEGSEEEEEYEEEEGAAEEYEDNLRAATRQTAYDSQPSHILYCGIARKGALIHQSGMVTQWGALAAALASKADEYIIGKVKIYEANGYLWVCVSDVPTNLAVLVLVEEGRMPNRVALSFANAVRDLYLFHLGLQANLPALTSQEIVAAVQEQRSPTRSEWLGSVRDREPLLFHEALVRWVSGFDIERTRFHTLPAVDRIDFSSTRALLRSTDPVEGTGDLLPSFTTFDRAGTRSVLDGAEDPSHDYDLEADKEEELLTHQEHRRRRKRRCVAVLVALLIVIVIVAAVLYVLFRNQAI